VDILSPAKLLVIAVVALAVLGPDKLPTLAKQVGSLWRDFTRFRQKLETDVRGSFPDLPSTETITRAVRAPLSFLDTLADAPTATEGATEGAVAAAAVAVDSEAAVDAHPDSDEDPLTPSHAGEVESPVEFDPETGVYWPSETVTASDASSPEPPVLVTPAGGVVHEVRSDSTGSLPDPGAN